MIAIIPARGGSKGLPDKNIKLLNGKPLIAYTIDAAKKSELISDIYVSTDSKEIAKEAINLGAKAPFLRPDYLASDDAKVVDTYLYMLNKWEDSGIKVNEFIVLQPTSPLRTSEDIDNAIKLFKANNADSVVSYTKEAHPISWHKYVNEDLTFSQIFEEDLSNRQEKRVTYYPNGAIYVFKSELIRKRKYFSTKSYAYLMERNKSIDIDYIDDFRYAEFLLRERKRDGAI